MTAVQVAGSAVILAAREMPSREMSVLLSRFPPRPTRRAWASTCASADDVLARLSLPPFTVASPTGQSSRRTGLAKVLRWLEQQPGSTWQQRWDASSADAAGNVNWRWLCTGLTATSQTGVGSRSDFIAVGRAMLALIAADVIRPSLGWLLTPGTPKNLAAEMARGRDPQAFARLAILCDGDPAGAATKDGALRRIALIMAANGGRVADITVGDCVALSRFMTAGDRRSDTGGYFYQLLHACGVFPSTAPAIVRMFTAQGQHTVEQMIDRYDIACRPIRDLIVEYLTDRRPVMDYISLSNLAVCLGKLFWKDLEVHHPGIDSLRLSPQVAAAWKQRIAVKKVRSTGTAGAEVQTVALRSDHGINYLSMVRAFYLDIAQWAMDDPSRWGPWAAPCPIRDEEMSFKKVRNHRKSRMDQRTRERLPVLDILVATVDGTRRASAACLEAALRTPFGEVFTAEGLTFSRPTPAGRGTATRTWGQDLTTGKRHDLTLAEHRAFWTWAAVEVLRHTGIRVEELTELSHHSFIQYRLPTTGELVPLLQIAPSKSDAERLLVISPELAEVLSAIVQRVRDPDGSVPLVVSYDIHERVWNPPMPLLFQRRLGMENRPVNAGAIRALLVKALAGTGLTDASNRALHFVPHDFRRLFITDAILNGMPPHIAQLVCGHKDINTTMGYKAVYPEEVINGHRAFIARRRATRPGEEYRTPTEEEWEEFLGHPVDCTTSRSMTGLAARSNGRTWCGRGHAAGASRGAAVCPGGGFGG